MGEVLKSMVFVLHELLHIIITIVVNLFTLDDQLWVYYYWHCNFLGEVEVNFVETHVGHDMDFRSQRLTIPEENEVVAKLKAGVSTDRIIRDARKFNEGELTRYNLLNKQDLTNYRIKHNIANKRDSNDMVAVTIKVQEWNSNGKNYAFLYKKIGRYNNNIFF